MSTFFILASERSGTNLLRSLLAAHSAIAAPAPAPVMSYFQRRSYIYQAYEEHPSSLIEDLQELLGLEGTPFQWDHIPPYEELQARFKGNGAIGVMAAFYEAYAASKGVQHSLCKESDLFEFPYLIERSFSDARFIYLVRDGRDVALSERNSPTKKRPTFLLAERWEKEQAHCLNAYGEFAPEGKAYFLRYEDLLKDPQGNMEWLLDWAGLEYEEGIFQYYRDQNVKSDASSGHLWENLDRPMMRDNSGKFRSELGKGRIRTFEKVAGHMLLRTGYEAENPELIGRKVPKGAEFYYRAFNKLDRFLKGRHTRKREKGIQSFLKHRRALVAKRWRGLFNGRSDDSA
ncbi:MAG: sulfotransferase [Flavobacteriales bacterium]